MYKSPTKPWFLGGCYIRGQGLLIIDTLRCKSRLVPPSEPHLRWGIFDANLKICCYGLFPASEIFKHVLVWLEPCNFEEQTVLLNIQFLNISKFKHVVVLYHPLFKFSGNLAILKSLIDNVRLWTLLGGTSILFFCWQLFVSMTPWNNIQRVNNNANISSISNRTSSSSSSSSSFLWLLLLLLLLLRYYKVISYYHHVLLFLFFPFFFYLFLMVHLSPRTTPRASHACWPSGSVVRCLSRALFGWEPEPLGVFFLFYRENWGKPMVIQWIQWWFNGIQWWFNGDFMVISWWFNGDSI